MQVLVNSDHHIKSDEYVTGRVEAIVQDSIGRFSARITRVEVFLSDGNGPKHGPRDKRCVMEAHVSGAAPVVGSDEAPSLLEAIEAAGTKLQRALEHELGRLAAASGKGPRDSDTASVDELEQLEKWQQDRSSHKQQ